MYNREFIPAILAGGLGTRLRSALPNLPKILAPVAGRPFVTYLLDQLIRAGFREVVLLTGHLGDEVCRELGQSYGPLRLIYSQERTPLGTARAIRAGLAMVPANQLLVMNGDSYVSLDLVALPRFQACRGGSICMTLACVDATERFGKVKLGINNQVIEFQEKKASGGAGWINAGVYLVDRNVVEEIPDDMAVSLERDILPKWVSRGKVFGFCASGRFIDIGTPDSFARAGEFFLARDHEALTHAN